MALVYRSDRFQLAPIRRLDDGRVVVEATIARTGTQIYHNADGTERREYRSEREVRASLDSFKLTVVTDDHPPVMITAGNARQYARGQVGESVRFDGKHVIATLVINDADLIRKMDAGKLDVSCGYACELDETPGTSPDGERFDCSQLAIAGNHVAIVDEGRAGTARARMDGTDVLTTTTVWPAAPAQEQHRAAGARNDSIMTLEQALAALNAANEKIGAEKTRADNAEQKTRDTERKLAESEQAAAQHKQRGDQAEASRDEAVKARKDAGDKYDARVAARANLQAAAIQHLGRDKDGAILRADGKVGFAEIAKVTDRELQAEIVLKLDGVKVPADRSDDACAYAYEIAVGRASASKAALAGTREVIEHGRGDAAGSGDKEAAARAASKTKMQNAWKTDAQGVTAASAKEIN